MSITRNKIKDSPWKEPCRLHLRSSQYYGPLSAPVRYRLGTAKTIILNRAMLVKAAFNLPQEDRKSFASPTPSSIASSLTLSLEPLGFEQEQQHQQLFEIQILCTVKQRELSSSTCS